MLVGLSWSLRFQFFINHPPTHPPTHPQAMFGYGMSSVYPLGMSWPGEAGFYMDTATTAHLVRAPLLPPTHPSQPNGNLLSTFTHLPTYLPTHFLILSYIHNRW